MIRAAVAERSVLAASAGAPRWVGVVPRLGVQDIPGASASAMTLALRYVPDAALASEAVLHDTTSGYRTFLGYRSETTTWRVFTPDGAPSRNYTVPAGSPCSVVLSIDAAGFQLYVNGVPQFTGTTQIALTGAGARNVRLGADLAQARQTWLPFAAVYDRKVDDVEALALHRWMSGRLPTEPVP